MPFIALALLVAAVIGGGAAVAAQHSLPGDALWGFKVAMNERVAEMLAVGEKAKADADITFAQARLDEAVELGRQGMLDTKAQAELGGNFDAHARAVATRVAAMQQSSDYTAAADVAARFQAMLARHISGNPGLQAALDTASALSADASAQAAAHLPYRPIRR